MFLKKFFEVHFGKSKQTKTSMKNSPAWKEFLKIIVTLKKNASVLSIGSTLCFIVGASTILNLWSELTPEHCLDDCIRFNPLYTNMDSSFWFDTINLG